MKMYLSDFYKVENYYPLDEVQIDSLYLLYQPIIGSDALNVYMTLFCESKRMSRFITPCSLSRLLLFLSIRLIDLEKHIRVLEGIGLLKTFVKNKDNETYYLFQIQSPLSLKKFFKNQLLQTLLYEALGLDDFNKTKDYFKKKNENISEYEEMTSSFQDVFRIDLQKVKGRVLDYHDDFEEKQSKDVVVDYDMELLYNELRNYQISRVFFRDDDESLIKQLATVYSIDILSMVSIIKDSMVQNKLDHQLIRKNAKKFHDIDSNTKLKEVYLKQPIQYKINDNTQSQLMKHLRYLETITPYELLKQKQGGKEPVFHDLMIVETLMVQLGLKPAVVNVLIEYVLGTNENRLSRSYCEAIGSSWARKKIVNVKQAYDEAMSKNNDKVENNIVDEVEEVNDTSHQQNLMSLIDEYNRENKS